MASRLNEDGVLELPMTRMDRTSSQRSRESSTEGSNEPALQGDPLTAYDVFSLIVNKMIGSGIFNNPSVVLTLTGSKKKTMGLWVGGFVYTIVSMLIYLEFSAVFPYTGGELIYVREVTSEQANSRPRRDTGEPRQPVNQVPPKKKSLLHAFLGDGLLALVVYSFLFVAFFNSGTNSLQAAKEILLAIHPDDEPNADVLRLIAVFALSILCWIHYASPAAGRSLNRWFASTKIFILFITLVAGIVMTHKSTFIGTGFQECSPSSTSDLEIAKAMLFIVFSFEGWENATFVAGEISSNDPKALRQGFLFAVVIVGCLYMSIVAVFLYAVPYLPVAVTFPAMLFGNSQAAYQGWAIVIAFSSLGSLNSIIYTYSRIKQCIGYANVLPWSSFWKQDSPNLEGQRNLDSQRSPKGGLVLHWIQSVVLIAISASMSSTLESISLPGLLQTYAHCLILAFVGLGALRLPSRAADLGLKRKEKKNVWDWRLSDIDSGWRWVLAIIVIIYAIFNISLLTIPAIKPYGGQVGSANAKGWIWKWENSKKTSGTWTCSSSDGPSASVFFPVPPILVPTSPPQQAPTGLRGWILPVVIGGVLILSFLYYLALFGASTGFPWSFSLAKVAATRRFGSRSEITYEQLNLEQEPSFLYWLFGGTNQYRFAEGAKTPMQQFTEAKHGLREWFESLTTRTPSSARTASHQRDFSQDDTSEDRDRSRM